MPLLVLVGLPGSGKSHFAQALLRSNPQKYVSISQDELGSRGACEEALGKAAKRGSVTVVLDRCNATAADRAQWRAVAFGAKWSCVHFVAGRETCEARVRRRVGHPTIAWGSGSAVVEAFAKSLEPPSKEREGFDEVHVVPDFEASDALLAAKFGVDRRLVAELSADASQPEHLLKFPRTAHLAALGQGAAVTRDDLMYPDPQHFVGGEGGPLVTVEEKVDGANLGITMDESYSFVCMNRSHFVNSATATQWKALDTFLDEFAADLMTVLGDQPGRYVLYGEWCAFQHTVPYTALPGTYFVAFDLFDKRAGKFLSRDRFRERLADTRIPTVPTLCTRAFATLKELEQLVLTTDSRFGDTKVEGVYLRVDDGDHLKHRSKIVRPDFTQGVEDHWTKGGMRPNKISFEG
jgi:atypical dual specificity phosphatase